MHVGSFSFLIFPSYPLKSYPYLLIIEYLVAPPFILSVTDSTTLVQLRVISLFFSVLFLIVIIFTHLIISGMEIYSSKIRSSQIWCSVIEIYLSSFIKFTLFYTIQLFFTLFPAKTSSTWFSIVANFSKFQ